MLDRDQDGFFVNRSSLAYVLPPWSEIIEEGIAALSRYLGEDMHSIYLRGSVAEGTAVLGLADVDLLAVLEREVTARDHAWKEETQASFRERMPLVCEVEFDLVPHRRLVDGETGMLWQFALATQGVYLAGENLLPHLPRFRPTRALAVRFVEGTRQHVRGAHVRLDEAGDSAAVQRTCRRSAKYLLRAAANLQLEEEGSTRDLREAARIVVRHYPNEAAAVETALRLAATPSRDPVEIRAFLDEFGGWLCGEIDRFLVDRRS